jgi:hypothetical protein
MQGRLKSLKDLEIESRVIPVEIKTNKKKVGVLGNSEKKLKKVKKGK